MKRPMDKWVICVAVSSAAGSILYGLWALLEQGLTKEEHIQALQNGINVVVVLFSLLAAGALGLCIRLFLTPSYMFFPVRTRTVKEVLECFTLIWIVGMSWRLIRYFLQWCHLRREVNGCMPCDKRTRRILAETCRHMGIKKNIEIFQSMLMPTAKIEGSIRPRIYLPAIEYEEEVLRAILCHELTHYQNRDRWIRHCALILGCIHWFNPLVKKMHRSLDRWDEYYCDYRVCFEHGIDREQYIRVLLTMAEYAVGWQERWHKAGIMELPLTADGQELAERIERMRKYQGNRKQKGLLAAALCMAFVLLGSSTVLAAGSGLNEAYGKWMQTTYTEYTVNEAQPIEENVLQEFELSPKEAAAAEALMQSGNGSDIQPQAQPTATISATVQENMWNSGAFYAYSGQNVAVSVHLDPADVEVKVGIVEPDGTWRLVEGYDAISHTFYLDQTGYYQVFVWNQTDTSVTVYGHYMTRSSN